jgi:hypothetical protein
MPGPTRGRPLAPAGANLAAAHAAAQEELRAVDEEGVDTVHAEMLATASAVLMRGLALELRARRVARARAEKKRREELHRQHGLRP